MGPVLSERSEADIYHVSWDRIYACSPGCFGYLRWQRRQALASAKELLKNAFLPKPIVVVGFFFFQLTDLTIFVSLTAQTSPPRHSCSSGPLYEAERSRKDRRFLGIFGAGSAVPFGGGPPRTPRKPFSLTVQLREWFRERFLEGVFARKPVWITR